MSANIWVVGNTKSPPLQLEVRVGLPLRELDEQVNSFCAHAEGQGADTVIFCLASSELNRGFWPGDVEISDVNKWERTVRRLERLRALTICTASGMMGGPVLDLLLATDYRVVSNDFRLVMPVNDGQIWPGMALHRLANQIGQAWSRRLILGTREITAQGALEIGLVDEIGEISPEIISLLDLRFANLSGAEISIRRQLVLEAQTTTFEDARGTYLAACDRELRRLRSNGELAEQKAVAK